MVALVVGIVVVVLLEVAARVSNARREARTRAYYIRCLERDDSAHGRTCPHGGH